MKISTLIAFFVQLIEIFLQATALRLNSPADFASRGAFSYDSPSDGVGGTNNAYYSSYEQYSGPKYRFKCYVCEEKDPNSDCVRGNMFPEAYPAIDCDGYCYVLSYTLRGIDSRTTQRSCVPKDTCVSKTYNEMCQGSMADCTFNCCASEYCNSAPHPHSTPLPMKLTLLILCSIAVQKIFL
ncbi:uncharacterized protein LOC134845988 [Symsagittifera roscoffensis]|uniref:uncharacterized protein LOC134845988 n=1 Tax=Symsagittifera roscoffensis TaxID=84072 RepID=UPI00307C8349